MRLLFVNERLDYASATSYTMDLGLALLERGDQVRLCAEGGELRAAFQERGIQTYRVKHNIFSFRKLVEFLREYNPDLVHIQSIQSVPLGQKIARKLRKPYIVTVHNRPSPDAASIEGPGYRGIIALNEIIREALVNDQDLPKSGIRVIRRGIRFPRLRQDDELDLTRSDRQPVIGSIGRLDPEKGHEDLIRAARILRDRGVDALFAIVGEGQDEPRLRTIVRELDLEPYVTFSPHFARRSELFEHFDIVALPVLSSGVGVTALEAMAMGIPLVATTVGELLHIVQDGKTGLLVPVRDPKSLAAKIEQLIRSPSLCRQLSAQARQWVEKEFALETMVSDTRAFYVAVLQGLEEERHLEGTRR
jgi:glycosyltransferase involved in cell wall biosynthesis